MIGRTAEKPALSAATSPDTDRDNWNGHWLGLISSPPNDSVLAAVLDHYAQAHRAYHTMQHLRECLALLDCVAHLSKHAHEVGVALWFHDAIYLPRRDDNEVRSAQWLEQVAGDLHVRTDSVARMRALIMATCHCAVPADNDAQLLVDIDLSILAASTERFAEYERQIRREYRWVPKFIYRRERGKVLAGFLARPRIFATDWFAERYETRARENLARLIEQL